jgi:hypothetical protein
MPTKRQPLGRRRTSPFSDETLALYARGRELWELTREFYRVDLEMTRRLGLEASSPGVFGDELDDDVFPQGIPGDPWRQAARLKQELEAALAARRPQ